MDVCWCSTYKRCVCFGRLKMFLTSPVIQLHRNSRSLITGCMYKCFNRHRSSKPEQTVNIFNRKAKRMQRDRSALNKDYMVFEYLREEVSYTISSDGVLCTPASSLALSCST